MNADQIERVKDLKIVSYQTYVSVYIEDGKVTGASLDDNAWEVSAVYDEDSEIVSSDEWIDAVELAAGANIEQLIADDINKGVK